MIKTSSPLLRLIHSHICSNNQVLMATYTCIWTSPANASIPDLIGTKISKIFLYTKSKRTCNFSLRVFIIVNLQWTLIASTKLNLWKKIIMKLMCSFIYASIPSFRDGNGINNIKHNSLSSYPHYSIFKYVDDILLYFRVCRSEGRSNVWRLAYLWLLYSSL